MAGPTLRAGSMFTGYGGLDMAVAAVLDTSTAWVADPNGPARRVLRRTYPGTPNLGDVTGIRWADQAPIDVLVAGFPCQNVSVAGRRAGLNPDQSDRLFAVPSMWEETLRAVDALAPALLVIENVGGLLNAPADAVGQPGRGSAFGAVLTDLADRGLDTEWVCADASAAGAPHRRRRVFIAAADRTRLRRGPWADGPRPEGTAEAGHRGAVAGRGRDHRGTGCRGSASADPDGAGREGAQSAGGRVVPARGGSRAAADSDRDRLERLTTEHGAHRPVDGEPGHDADRCDLGRDAGRPGLDWGDYAAAIDRWERTVGRRAPAPSVLGTKGGRVLNPAFVEWLMGLPDGHVTATPGLQRRDMLKLLGNGVVPQQAALALPVLLDRLADTEAA